MSSFILPLKNKIKYYFFKRHWIKKNSHNKIIPTRIIPSGLVTVGIHSYGYLTIHHFGSPNESLKIGNYCSIGPDVKFILGGNHFTNTISSFPFKYYFNNHESEAQSKGPIVLEDDVWIGANSLILSGVTLRKGTIVGAGSVVTKSTLPYSINGGNPSKLLKMRFNDEVLIKKLLDLEFINLDENKILKMLPKMYEPLDLNNFEELKNELFTL